MVLQKVNKKGSQVHTSIQSVWLVGTSESLAWSCYSSHYVRDPYYNLGFHQHTSGGRCFHTQALSFLLSPFTTVPFSAIGLALFNSLGVIAFWHERGKTEKRKVPKRKEQMKGKTEHYVNCDQMWKKTGWRTWQNESDVCIVAAAVHSGITRVSWTGKAQSVPVWASKCKNFSRICF